MTVIYWTIWSCVLPTPGSTLLHLDRPASTAPATPLVSWPLAAIAPLLLLQCRRRLSARIKCTHESELWMEQSVDAPWTSFVCRINCQQGTRHGVTQAMQCIRNHNNSPRVCTGMFNDRMGTSFEEPVPATMIRWSRGADIALVGSLYQFRDAVWLQVSVHENEMRSTQEWFDNDENGWRAIDVSVFEDSILLARDGFNHLLRVCSQIQLDPRQGIWIPARTVVVY